MTLADDDEQNHCVSTYVSQSTGRTTQRHPNLQTFEPTEGMPQDSIDHELNILAASTMHTYRNQGTGEVTNMSITTHGYGGGFAVTARQIELSVAEPAFSSSFLHTDLRSLPRGVDHVFRLQIPHNFLSRQTLDDVDRVGNDNPNPPRDLQQHLNHLPVIAQAKKRNFRRRKNANRQAEPKLSEEQLFANAIQLHARRTAFLSHMFTLNPHTRSHHVVTSNRTLAYTSAFLSSDRGPKAVLSVLWETKKKPHSAVTVNLSIPEGSHSIHAPTVPATILLQKVRSLNVAAIMLR